MYCITFAALFMDAPQLFSCPQLTSLLTYPASPYNSANSDDVPSPDFYVIVTASLAAAPRFSFPHVHALLPVFCNQRLEHVDARRTVLLAECVLSATI